MKHRWTFRLMFSTETFCGVTGPSPGFFGMSEWYKSTARWTVWICMEKRHQTKTTCNILFAIFPSNQQQNKKQPLLPIFLTKPQTKDTNPLEKGNYTHKTLLNQDQKTHPNKKYLFSLRNLKQKKHSNHQTKPLLESFFAPKTTRLPPSEQRSPSSGGPELCGCRRRAPALSGEAWRSRSSVWGGGFWGKKNQGRTKRKKKLEEKPGFCGKFCNLCLLFLFLLVKTHLVRSNVLLLHGRCPYSSHGFRPVTFIDFPIFFLLKCVWSTVPYFFWSLRATLSTLYRVKTPTVALRRGRVKAYSEWVSLPNLWGLPGWLVLTQSRWLLGLLVGWLVGFDRPKAICRLSWLPQAASGSTCWLQRWACVAFRVEKAGVIPRLWLCYLFYFRMFSFTDLLNFANKGFRSKVPHKSFCSKEVQLFHDNSRWCFGFYVARFW